MAIVTSTQSSLEVDRVIFSIPDTILYTSAGCLSSKCTIMYTELC